MREDDIPHVMAIERRVFSLPWSPGIYRYELRHNRFARYLVLAADHPPLPPVVGYGGVWLHLPEAHISTIAVHPELRGLHLGAWLLAALLVLAADKGAGEATLEVRVSNTVAQGLYRSFGFDIVGQRRRYYSDNKEDAYIMTLKPLDASSLRERLQVEIAEAQRRWAERHHRILQRLAGTPENGVAEP